MITSVSRLFNSIWQRYEHTIDYGYPASVNATSLFRVGFASFLLLVNVIPDLRWMGSQPSIFYSPPPGLPAIWGTVLPAWALTSLELALIASIVLLLLGWRTPGTSVAVCVIGLVANSIYFSFGKIDHTIMTWMVPLAFAWSGWGGAFSLDSRKGPPVEPPDREMAASRAIFATGVMLSVSYLTAALPKLAGGWLSLENSAAQGQFLYLSEQLDRKDLLAGVFTDFDIGFVWEAADWATIALELTIGFTLLWPVLQRRVIFLLWVFHIVNSLVLNISFNPLVPVYPVFFLPLVIDGQAERVLAFLNRHLRVALAFLAVATVFAFYWQGLWWFLMDDLVGLSSAERDFTLFAIGFVALVLLAVATGGYRRPIGSGAATTRESLGVRS